MTLTKTGFAEAAGLFGGVTSGVFDYIELGTGTTGATSDDTALETPTAATGLARAQATNSRVTTTVTNDTSQSLKTFTNTSGGTVAVTEAGLFDAASTGVMADHQVFTAVGVENGNSLQVTYQIKFSA